MFQIIEQTDEEKLAMYMKLDKEELAKMLIEANKRLAQPIIINVSPQPYTQPFMPYWQSPPTYIPGPFPTVTCGAGNYGGNGAWS